MKYRQKSILATVVTATLAGALLVAAPATSAVAAPVDNAAFDPGFIISDEIFFNGDDMTGAQVQSFLNSVSASCVSTATLFCMKDFTMETADRAATAYCTKYDGSNNESAASIIAKIAKSCGISARALLVTLQKEQGLVTNPKSAGTYKFAMGYGCPDNPPGCDPAFAGFSYQLFRAASQFQVYRFTEFGNYKPGRYNTVYFHPNGSCGSSKVWIRNQATAGLYNYTPYQPNEAALAAGSGGGDECSSYGNRNFWRYFTQWFGNPADPIKNPGFERNPGTSNWGPGSAGGITFTAVKNAAEARSGLKFAQVTASAPGSLLKQSISFSTKVDTNYEAGIWVKSALPGVPVAGEIAVWAVGGDSTEKAASAFEAGDTWTQVKTELTVEKSGHKEVRLIVQFETVGVTLLVDDASFTAKGEVVPPQTAMITNGLRNHGFEEVPGFTNWEQGASNAGRTFDAHVGSQYTRTGNGYLRALATAPGERAKQTLPFLTEVGESYTASMWVRAARDGETAAGALYLYAAGGAMESAFSSFEVGTEWTLVSVDLPIANAGHTEFRFVVQLDSVDTWLRVDDTDLRLTPAEVEEPEEPEEPIIITDNALLNPGFEMNPGVSHWTAGSAGSMSFKAVLGPTEAQAGRKYVSMNTGVGGRRIKQTLKVTPTANAPYTGGVWLRAATPSDVIAGELSVWVVGDGANEISMVPFEVSGEWTFVSTDVAVTRSGHREVRFVIQLNTTGKTLWADSAQFGLVATP